MAYKVFSNGSVLQASEINDNLMNQSVMVFTNSAARSAAITTPLEGMLTWLQDINEYEYYSGSAWVSLIAFPGLELIKTQAIGAGVSTITVSSAFSGTFDNYKITMSGGAATADAFLSMKLGASATGYYQVRQGFTYGGTSNNGFDNNAAQWTVMGRVSPDFMHLNCELNSPFLAKKTTAFTADPSSSSGLIISGIHSVQTSYTDFTLTLSSGSMTGGNIHVYGYRE